MAVGWIWPMVIVCEPLLCIILQSFSLINSEEFRFYEPSTIWSVLIPVSAIWNNAHFISIWIMPILLVWESFVCSHLRKSHPTYETDRIFLASVLESMYTDAVSFLLISVFRITFSCPWELHSPFCWLFLIWMFPFSLWLLPYWLPWEENGNTSLGSPKQHWPKLPYVTDFTERLAIARGKCNIEKLLFSENKWRSTKAILHKGEGITPQLISLLPCQNAFFLFF